MSFRALCTLLVKRVDARHFHLLGGVWYHYFRYTAWATRARHRFCDADIRHVSDDTRDNARPRILGWQPSVSSVVRSRIGIDRRPGPAKLRRLSAVNTINFGPNSNLSRLLCAWRATGE